MFQVLLVPAKNDSCGPKSSTPNFVESKKNNNNKDAISLEQPGSTLIFGYCVPKNFFETPQCSGLEKKN